LDCGVNPAGSVSFLNTSVRKFLKKLGVTAQRKIEMAVLDADAKGLLKGSYPLPAKADVTVAGIDLKFEIDGDIDQCMVVRGYPPR
jgi:Family of unknown function (DUF6494)